ncbi:hypothetical protein CAEBREN_20912 [Caenorhabditis brenneri]|uniref:Uncharacterized protein n=1 Tax=Caenorhabditis brenneri TaxID=135651 RepID=G0PG75_CAEBE|nr:hypothetical protein CAEBREN_20912 [Caenorhabditis brenneri]
MTFFQDTQEALMNVIAPRSHLKGLEHLRGSTESSIMQHSRISLEMDMNNVKEKIDRLESIEMRLINVVTVFAADAMKIYQVETDCHLKLNTSAQHVGNRLAHYAVVRVMNNYGG